MDGEIKRVQRKVNCYTKSIKDGILLKEALNYQSKVKRPQTNEKEMKKLEQVTTQSLTEEEYDKDAIKLELFSPEIKIILLDFA
jgi:hypothetical protein